MGCLIYCSVYSTNELLLSKQRHPDLKTIPMKLGKLVCVKCLCKKNSKRHSQRYHSQAP